MVGPIPAITSLRGRMATTARPGYRAAGLQMMPEVLEPTA
jgi:hypothetical protein